LNPRDLEDVIAGLEVRIRNNEQRLVELEQQARIIRFVGGALVVAVIGLVVQVFGHVLFG